MKRNYSQFKRIGYMELSYKYDDDCIVECSRYVYYPALWPRIALVVAIILCVAAFAHAGPKERIAIAEAAVWVAQNQFPAGENDYDGSKSAKNPETPDSSEPRFEFPANIEPVTANVEPLTATVYTAEQFNGDGWCGRCNTLKRDWGNGDDRLRLVWSRERVPEGGEAIYPAIRFHGVKGYTMPSDAAGRYKIPASLADLAAMVEKNTAKTESAKAVAPSGSAGSIHAKSQIKQVFAWWRANIGEGVKVSATWDRTGGQSFPLLAKADWSWANVCGKYGHVGVDAKGSKLPFDSIGFGYTVKDGFPEIDLDNLPLRRLIESLSPESSKSVATQPSEVSPGTVLTIISVIRGLYSILNPQADLQLGGNVSATAVLNGDTLAIDFQQCPSVKLVALFTFQLRVDRVEVVEDKHVRVLFGGSRIVKERTFAIK